MNNSRNSPYLYRGRIENIFRLMRSAGAGKYVAELIEDDLNGNEFSVEPYCDPQRFLKP